MASKKNRTAEMIAGTLSGAALGAALGVGLFRRYQADSMAARHRRLLESHMMMTEAGVIEMALAGEGLPVLFSHGIMGSYDHGVGFAALLPGCQVIAVSRPGYLGTPLETARTPQALAGVYAALLDVLELEKVVMLGVSAGAMSALHFALMYPDRCSALVLVSAISRALPPSLLQPLEIMAWLARYDVLMWGASKIGAALIPLLKSRNPHTRQLLKTYFSYYPGHARVSGIRNDLQQAAQLDIIPFEQISVPTQIIHGTADSLVPFEMAARTARHIPLAHLVAIDGSDHECLVTHREETVPVMQTFLKAFAR